MKVQERNQISITQFIFIIHSCQVGTGIFSLPRTLAEKAGTDGWISLLLGWCINLTVCVLIVKMFEKYPDDTILDLFIRLFGKVVGKILTIPIICYFAFFGWTILSITMLFIKQWFLQMTPDYVLMILLVVPGFFIIGKGLYILGRYSELVFYMTIWMYLLLIIPLKDSHWVHLLPLIKEGWMPIFNGVGSAIFSFLGFEIVLVLYPFLKTKQLAVRGVVIANTITFILYLGVTLICYAYFSPDGITDYNEPLFNLLKMIELHFLERFDMVFLALYLFVISTAWLPYLYGAVYSTSHLLGTKKKAPFDSILLISIVIITAFLHPSWNQTGQWIEFISKTGIGVAYVFPVFLFLYVSIYSRFQRSGSQ
ncbi:spore gernimation protein [Paenibacillus sp. FSL A5-0031]|uniref:GerAB/ArcD/ProY family transporter n=1 Tax=Paenibacillus sp. FSL A5-0031 TaxID=1920420 RepID=UPI00096C9253|nr:endospore germination permease [Paenibacillus sp. FSL A5-0031]OME82278.1 spore gernimation protein [Paenibacillus sp. FSL A5-0031]